jgi:ubiquinol-cytochrome c reductase cytochrome b subunit
MQANFRKSLWQQPLLNVVNSHLIAYPTPVNLNGNYNYGVLAGMTLVLQIATGVFLAMHYTAHVDLAFASIQHIMREVPNGWMLRFLHANGASLFFIVVYLHLFRAIYYTSYAQPREAVWLIGVVLLLVMIITAFIGYVLPWGQISLWGVEFARDDLIAGVLTYTSSEPKPFSGVGATRGFAKNSLDSLLREQKDKPKRLMARHRIGPHNKDVQDVLVGSLLGDASAQQRSGNTRICFRQAHSHEEYLLWLHEFFATRSYCNPKIPEVKTRIDKEGNIRHHLRFNTWTYSSFNWIYDAFYPNKVKVVPDNIQELLSPLALAVWIMDDGSKAGNGLNLATHCFSVPDIEKLLAALRNIGLVCTMHIADKSKEQYTIYISTQSQYVLRDLVLPYIVPSMLYKLGL